MKSYKAYKIIVAVIFAVITILSSIFLADALMSEESLGRGLGYVVWIILAIPAFAVSVITSLIGVILSVIKRKQGLCSGKTLTFFIVFSVLPVIVFFLSFLIGKIILG